MEDIFMSTVGWLAACAAGGCRSQGDGWQAALIVAVRSRLRWWIHFDNLVS